MSPLPHGKGTSIFQNGDLILSEMGTKRGFRQQKKGTKKCVYLINWLKRANSLKEGKHFLWQILTWILFKMYFQPVLTSNFWKAEGRGKRREDCHLDQPQLFGRVYFCVAISPTHKAWCMYAHTKSNKWGWDNCLFSVGLLRHCLFLGEQTTNKDYGGRNGEQWRRLANTNIKH